jgi:hypothetical protein
LAANPPEPLQPLRLRAGARGRSARAAWLTGVPFLASDGRSPLWALTGAAQSIDVDEPTAWLARGLEQRADHAHLHGEALAMYRDLRAEGATMPPGIGVCEDCAWVFRHSPKRAAAKCSRCNRRSHQAERQPWHLAVIEDETYDDAGLPSGWQRRYLVQCVGCDAPPFWAERADHKHCSDRCRVRAHREAR